MGSSPQQTHGAECVLSVAWDTGAERNLARPDISTRYGTWSADRGALAATDLAEIIAAVAVDDALTNLGLLSTRATPTPRWKEVFRLLNQKSTQPAVHPH